eukprot:4670652-Amphidinium_carterae.1
MCGWIVELLEVAKGLEVSMWMPGQLQVGYPLVNGSCGNIACGCRRWCVVFSGSEKVVGVGGGGVGERAPGQFKVMTGAGPEPSQKGGLMFASVE